MQEIYGENLVPNGGLTGAAYVLGRGGPDPLSVLINGQRTRAAEKAKVEAANQKDADENFKEYKWQLEQSDKAETGPTYQRMLAEEGPKIRQDLNNIYLDKNLDRFQRTSAADALIRAHKIRATAGKQIDANLAKVRAEYGNDAEINQEQYWKDVHASQFQKDEAGNPDVTRPIAPLDYDQTTPERLLADRRYLNVPTLYGNFAKQLAPTQTTQQAAGGRPGTMATSYTDKIRFWKRNPDGTLLRNPKTGEAQMDITNDLLEHAMGNERIKRDLQGLMTEHKTSEESAMQKMGRQEQLTPEERAALDVDPTMKDLLGRRLTQLAIAEHHETQRYNRYPRPVAAPKASGAAAQFNEAEVAPAEVGATVKGTPSPFEQALGLEEFTKNQENFYTPRKSAAPTFTLKSGVVKPREFDSLYSREVVQEDGKGNLTTTTGNKKPMSGYYGEAHQLPVNPKTGEVHFPKNDAEYSKLVREGNVPQSYIAVYTNKNEDFTGDYKRYLKDLQTANAQQYDPTRKKGEADMEA